MANSYLVKKLDGSDLHTFVADAFWEECGVLHFATQNDGLVSTVAKDLWLYVEKQ